MFTILVIEDDHDSRVYIRNILENAGYFVISAANGLTGLALLKSTKPPSVIILDQNMPIMNSDSFLSIRKSDPTLSQIPVIVLSAAPDRSLAAGANEFIAKPINIPILLEIIRKYCVESTKSD